MELLLGLLPLLLLLPELLQLGSCLTKRRQQINNKNENKSVYNVTHFSVVCTMKIYMLSALWMSAVNNEHMTKYNNILYSRKHQHILKLKECL